MHDIIIKCSFTRCNFNSLFKDLEIPEFKTEKAEGGYLIPIIKNIKFENINKNGLCNNSLQISIDKLGYCEKAHLISEV